MNESHRDPRGEGAMVRQVQAGDLAATQQLLERLACIPRFLQSLARRRLRVLSSEELAELSQETLALVWSNLHRFEGRAALESWVFSFCRNTMRSAHRRFSREASFEAREPEVLVPPSCMLATDRRAVRRALAHLPRASAQIVWMKHFQDLSFRAISSQLGVPLSTVKARYYRGLAQLRTRLRGEFAEPPGRGKPGAGRPTLAWDPTAGLEEPGLPTRKRRPG